MTGEQTIIQIDREAGFWTVVDKIFEDLLQQHIPASVVLLIVACLIAPFLMRFVWRWWFGTKRRD